MLLDIFFHLDKHLGQWAGALGPWLYVVLFAIIFCETGLVVTPYLPGDSLLFAVGALAASPDSPISLTRMWFLLAAAAFLGDAANYAAGHWIGPKIFSSEDSFWFHKKHLWEAQHFYDKYGPKTIVLARFVPLVRTFAPFVAGIGKMSYPRFAVFNVMGGILWTSLFLGAGYRFAELPIVKERFHYVILAIIFISLVPVAVEFLKTRRTKAV